MSETLPINGHASTRHKTTKQPIEPEQTITDGLIQQTNSSSIVSKRSVEKIYYADQPAFFRHFVAKFKRRSPLINRGYWLRMRAIEHAVESFLLESTSRRKVVINLGCGFDPLPWLFLGKRQDLCKDIKFLDVDYPALMQQKITIIKRTSELTSLLPDLAFTSAQKGLLCDSAQYAAIGCDLRNLTDLRRLLAEQGISQDSAAILFVAEVSVAYMDMQGSQAVIEFAHEYVDARFCLLEQCLPDGKDHPFAKTMLSHFDKIRTPLHTIGTITEMRQRFVKAGWHEGSVDIRSLWHLWSDSTFLTGQEKRDLDKIEPFDEWEEFALFCSHYFLLVARSHGTVPQRRPDTYSNTLCTGGPIVCEEIISAPCQRRFAALLTETTNPEEDVEGWRLSARGVIAGLGKQERLADTASYIVGSQPHHIEGPPLRQGLMCHTATQISHRDVLVVGGRTSPDRATSDCWLRKSGSWRKVQSLPEGRYRHCAVSCPDEAHQDGVLIFGGRSSTGQLFSSLSRWTEQSGWTEVETDISIEARFGATMIRTGNTSTVEGLLFGGMNNDRDICQDVWHWRWDESQNVISLTSRSPPSTQQDSPFDPICRFGAQTVLWNQAAPDGEYQSMLVGGIGSNGLIPRDVEFYNLGTDRAHPLRGHRPLLIGANMDPYDRAQMGSKTTRLSFGGGATCFSFGTYWNKSVLAIYPENVECRVLDWHLCSERKPDVVTVEEDNVTPVATTEVQVIQAPLSSEDFQDLLKHDKPAILRNCNLGPCTTLWTPEYLKTTLQDRQVVVHASNTPKMDFQTKNFRYEDRKFADFIDSVLAGELLYMRALSSASPTERPTTLAADFPEIAKDFQLPPELAFVVENAHSSPLRVSGKTVMWLHYDVMANVLCQIRGSKTLMLYPPLDIPHLGIEAGMSSSSLDVFSASPATSLKRCHPHEARLQAGDILFIPALWLHTAAPTDEISIATNVFFRHLRDGYAAGKDVYGNRDLAVYERGRRDVARIVKSFTGLPADCTAWYLHQLSLELESENASPRPWESSGQDEARDTWEKARRDVMRIRRSLAGLPQKETGFYLTRLVIELRGKG